jgi:MFS family permease
MEAYSRSYRYRFIAGMALVVSFRILGLSLIIPVISVYGKSLTDSALLIGLAVGGYGATQALFQIPYGLASDKWGRKRLIVTGMLIFSIGSILGGFADTISLLILARILQGGGAVTATVFAFIHDVIEPQRRNYITALIGAPIGIFFSIGILAGPLIADQYGMNALFFISGGLSLFITLYLILFIHEIPTASVSRTISKRMLGEMFRTSDLLKIDIAGLLMHSSITSIFFLIPLILSETFNLEVRQYSYVYLPMILTAIVFMLLFSKVADRGYTRESIMVAFLLLTAGSLGMIFSDGVFIFGAGSILAYAGTSIMEPILPIFVGKVAKPQVVGTAMGAYSTVQFSGSFFGAVIVGLLLSYGFTAALLTLTTIGISGCILALTMRNPVQERGRSG